MDHARSRHIRDETCPVSTGRRDETCPVSTGRKRGGGGGRGRRRRAGGDVRPSERSTAPRTWVASYASAVRVSTMTCAASASTTTLNSARASSDGSSSTAASVASRPAAPSSLSPPASPADRSCSAAGDVRLCGAAPYACGARRAGRDAGTHQGAEGARAGGGRVKVAGRRGERGGRARRGAAAGARRLIESEAMQHARDRLRRRCARRGRERVRGAAALRQGAGAGRARCCGCTLWLGGSSRHVRRSLCVIGDASPRESSCSTPTRPRRGIRPSLKWRLSGGGRSGESRCCSDIERPSAGGVPGSSVSHGYSALGRAPATGETGGTPGLPTLGTLERSPLRKPCAYAAPCPHGSCSAPRWFGATP